MKDAVAALGMSGLHFHDLLSLHPTTAVRWMHEAGGDWSRYAADLARTRHHQP